MGGGIFFTNPGFAPWLAAALIPLAIHLARKRIAPTYPLPTLRFLRKGMLAGNRRWNRLRDPLLLILRTLVILALALAFMKPERAGPLYQKGAHRLVIVLDGSLSTGAARNGLTAFSREKRIAAAILSRSPSSLRPAVVVAGSTPKLISAAPPGDDSSPTGTGELVAAVNRLHHSLAGANLNSALGLAVNSIKSSGSPIGSQSETKPYSGPVPEVLICSDFQRNNWQTISTYHIPPGIHLALMPFRRGELSNTGVTSVQVNTSPDQPVAEVRATVLNASPETERIPVQLHTIGYPEMSQMAVIAPYQTKAVSFRVNLAVGHQNENWLRGNVAVPDDALSEDNHRYFATSLESPTAALLLTDEPADQPDAPANLLELALDPGYGVAGRIPVIRRTGTNLQAADFRGVNTVFVCDVPSMGDSQISSLLNYVRRGGAAIVFLSGNRVIDNIQNWRRFLKSGEDFPLAVERPQPIPPGGLAASNWRADSRWLGAFHYPNYGNLSSIRVNHLFITDPSDSHAHVLLRYTDGSDLLAERRFGAGAFLFLNISIAPTGSNLASRTIFPPLVHELASAAARHGNQPAENTLPYPAQCPLDAGEVPAKVIGPDGLPVRFHFDPASHRLIIGHPSQAGIYTISTQTHHRAYFAVNVPAIESDLRHLTTADLKKIFPRAIVTSEPSARGFSRLHQKIPIWPLLALATLAMITLDALLTLASMGLHFPARLKLPAWIPNPIHRRQPYDARTAD